MQSKITHILSYSGRRWTLINQYDRDTESIFGQVKYLSLKDAHFLVHMVVLWFSLVAVSAALARYGQYRRQRVSPSKHHKITMMAFPKITRGLCGLVKDKFNSAKDANALTYYPTEVALLYVKGLPV